MSCLQFLLALMAWKTVHAARDQSTLERLKRPTGNGSFSVALEKIKKSLIVLGSSVIHRSGQTWVYNCVLLEESMLVPCNFEAFSAPSFSSLPAAFFHHPFQISFPFGPYTLYLLLSCVQKAHACPHLFVCGLFSIRWVMISSQFWKVLCAWW